MSSFARILRAVAERISASADELNRLDGVAGDGDLGVTAATASSILLDLVPALEGQTLAETLRSCGLALARGAPSTAGTLIASGLLRAAKAAEARSAHSPAAAFAALLDEAARGIAERGDSQLGSKTLLDALIPAARAAEQSAAAGELATQALSQAADAADEGARATASMRAVHGRAGWLADRSAGHEDAGARLVAIALRAASDAAPHLRG